MVFTAILSVDTTTEMFDPKQM